MGTQLVRRVEAAGMAGRLDRLTHAARCTLYVCALNAHDTGTNDAPPGTYFRGWEHVAQAALGRSTYDSATERHVARVIAELVAAGYLKPVGRRNDSRHGHAMYEITM